MDKTITTDYVLHVLRNPYGHSEEHVRDVRLCAATRIEQLTSANDSFRSELAVAKGELMAIKNGCTKCSMIPCDVSKNCEKVKEWREENERLKKHIQWVITDIAYKAPEQYKDNVNTWIKHLQETLQEKE